MLTHFDSLIDHLVRDALCGSEILSFPQLLRLLPSVPQPDTLASLNRLRSSFPVAAQLIQDAGRTAQPSITQAANHNPLCTPHPLDYDWRFDGRTVESLLATSIALCGGSRSIAMIGTPTLALAAFGNAEIKHVVLLDANSCAVRRFAIDSPKIQALRIDVHRHPLPAVTAPVVITDAPWYAEYISRFLWAASQLCEIGGHVIASFPTVGSRPGIVAERDSLIAEAASNGLEYRDMKAEAVTYETPPFERSAFRACGIMNVPSDWRRGDLLLFQRISARASSHPPRAKPADEWVDIEIRGIRLKIRAPLPLEFDDPRLRSIIDGDVLPSVSRRDPRRRHVDIWTPRNRIFLCSGRSAFVQIARAIASEEKPRSELARWLRRNLTNAEQIAVEEAAEQLCSLVDREETESLG